MSYNVAYFKHSLTSKTPKEGHVLAGKIKKGMKLTLQVEANNGDDEDGVKDIDVEVTKTNLTKEGEVVIEFKSVKGWTTHENFDEVVSIDAELFYKI